VIGLALSLATAVLFVGAVEWSGLRQRFQRSAFFRWTPGIAWGFLPPEDHPLHALALLLGIVFAALVAVTVWLHVNGYSLVTPFVVLCLILGICNSVHAFLSSHLRGVQLVALVALIVSALVANSTLVDTVHAYKMSFPHMEPYYEAARAALTPGGDSAEGDEGTAPSDEYFIRLDEERWREKDEVKRLDHYRARVYRDPRHSAAAANLIDSEEPLRVMCERWQKTHPGTKPRLVISRYPNCAITFA
jgi:hypothetical protein